MCENFGELVEVCVRVSLSVGVCMIMVECVSVFECL